VLKPIVQESRPHQMTVDCRRRPCQIEPFSKPQKLSGSRGAPGRCTLFCLSHSLSRKSTISGPVDLLYKEGRTNVGIWAVFRRTNVKVTE